jgi:class 3 adenylate cyclase/tetratricopeptide (TPR) repeat protein
MKDVSIADWLAARGLAQYTEAFKANDIDLDVLPDLDVGELRELGVTLGDAKRILRAVREQPAAPAADGPTKPPAAADAERRQLTVVFCDLVGSTNLSETLDPEDLRALLGAYYSRCGEVARRFGGHLACVTGDGVDLYFGYPHALDRSAVAAVEAALEVAQSVAELNAERGPDVPALLVRIGVHTGLAVVGAVHGSSRDDGVAVGDVPVVAARIQSVARPGTVVVSEATAQLIRRDVSLEDLGLHELKGLSAPVRLFAVSPGGEPEADELGGEGDADLVDREAEMASLGARWELALAGHGQVVLLTGEAGIGKSKVAQTLATGLPGDPRCLSYQCSPFRSATALWPLVEQVRRAARIRHDDANETRLERLERALQREPPAPAQAELVPVFAALLGIDCAHRYPPLALTPEQLRERTLAIVADYLGALARDRPVIIVFEDVHWADPTSLELLGTVIERCAAWRLLLVLTCRPEHELPWPEQPHMTPLALGRLPDRDAFVIVDRVAEGKSVPKEVVERILTRTDGVPLFVEELTRTVLESKMLVDQGAAYALADSVVDVAIPATLHDSLATRLDRLGPVKEVAQIASVIGREFSFDLLAAAAGLDQGELQAALEALQRSGLVRRRDIHSPDRFAFKHALVQNAAYESMLRSRRRDLHARIAAALEQQADVRVEQPELLAHHLDLAGLVEPALDAYMRAAERAAGASHHEEALAHYKRALELIATLPASRERTERELEIQDARRNALVVQRGYSSPEVEQACRIARTLCDELGATERLFPALWNLAGYHMMRGEHATCTEINAQLLEIAAGADDPAIPLMAHDTVGQTLFYQGRFEEALSHLTRARDLYDASVHGGLAPHYAEEDPGVAALGYGGVVLWVLGARAAGRAWVTEAAALAESLPFLVTRAFAMDLAMHLAYCRSDLEAARTAAASLRAAADDKSYGYYVPNSRVHRGWVLAIDGEPEAGVALMRDGIAGLERIGAVCELPFNALLLADGLIRARQPRAAVSVLDEALDTIERTEERCLESELLRVRGETLAAHGAPDAAVERDLRKAVELTTERRTRSLRLRAATSLARWQLEHGIDRGGNVLADALAEIEDDLDAPDVREARTLVALL